MKMLWVFFLGIIVGWASIVAFDVPPATIRANWLELLQAVVPL